MPKISTIAQKICGDEMRYRNRKLRNCPALTILEIIIALAIITIIFAAVLPQFRVIQNGWDSRQAATEVLQNGRVLIDHINRNLSKAIKITAVSNPTETNGYIQFLGNDSNTYRYDINSTGSYIRYGQVGYTPADLAGPVSSLTFTCYDACDIATTDVNDIRLVDVNTILPNPAALGQNKTFTASVYLRADANNGGIVGCWKLDETSGTTAADSSGKGNNGTLVNMTTPGCWGPGQIGNALTFDGTDDYVDLGTGSSLNFGSSGPFTVSAWVKTTDSYGMIVSFRSSTDGGPVIDLAVGYDGGVDDPCKAMILVRQNGGSSYAHVTGGKVSDGFWHHIAAVRGSGSTIELFLDGVSQGTNSGAESGGAITTNLRAIGSERRWVSDSYGTADQRYLAGTIDDVRLYNRALTATEIAQLANIPTYRGFSKAKQDSDTTSIVISTPATNTGDLLIAAVATDGDTSASIAVPGWTLIDRGAPSGGRVTLGAWRKFSTGASEPATHTFSWAVGNPQQAYGWIMRFTGYDATSPSPINTSATADQNNIAPTSPAVTTTVPNCLILRLGAFDDTSVLQDNLNLLSGHTTITAGSSSGSSTIPNYQAAGTAQSSTVAITVPWPAHQAGDIALLFVESCGGQPVTLTTPAGFVNVTNSPQATGAGAAGTRLTVFWCRATSSSMSSPVVGDPGDHVYGRILTFRNVVATGDPWDVTQGGTKAAASTTTTFGAVTTSVNNTLIVLAASRDNDSAAAAWSGWTNANLSGLTERSDGGTTSGNGGGVGVATGLKSTAGSTGQTTATVTSSVDGHMTIALKPVGDGTVSGGAGYVKQSLAGGSGTSNFQLTASKDARMLTIAIAPATNGSYDCCGDYLRP
ncbi:MAG: LamG domain-containing protein [Sedimentisphaerales bacterium]